jgi:hypothetical protein
MNYSLTPTRKSEYEQEVEAQSKEPEELTELELEAQIEAAGVKLGRRKKPLGAARRLMLIKRRVALETELQRRRSAKEAK